MNHNENHLKKAKSSKIHNDRICNGLKNESIRDKILKGKISANECDDKNACDF